MTEAMMNIPDKLTFKRTEVIRLTKLDGKVIDFWQKEFTAFSPIINKLGEQFYSRHDVETILKIKQWLIVEKIGKLKIKELLKSDLENIKNINQSSNNNKSSGKISLPETREKIKIIKQHLKDILTILDKNDKN